MQLTAPDWVIIAAYLLIALGIGVALRGKASGSLADFFLGGRRLPWYVAGISMVATTFAADTPLLVTEIVARNGISGNWLWWNMLIGGMLTTFFFARLWRRSGVLTELEFIELRYSGPAARLLRGFKSIYMGLFLNAVIIGWVNVALMTILKIFFGISDASLFLIISAAMVFVALYSSLSGLLGVAITDMFQFIIAMTGCIILALFVLADERIGGISGLREQLPAWRFDFFPDVGNGSVASGIGKFSISAAAFFAFGAMQWWASWYPGAEPGGGGYISQRMMSTKNERHSVLATLFFQMAHYCLRPWPWIVVALASLVLYPGLSPEDAKEGFVFAMRDLLPTGLKGLLLVAFLSAYMSTISTQLNWGASYLCNDLYKRFIRKPENFENEQKASKHYVRMARIITLLIMAASVGATAMIDTIEGAAHFMIECGAGLGLVLMLRWYWWRINAWSEITATVAPFIAFVCARYWWNLEFPNSFFITVGATTLCWITVTMLTPPDRSEVLAAFWKKTRPPGIWGRFASGKNQKLWPLFAGWLLALTATYGLLFGTGKWIFFGFVVAVPYLTCAVLSGILLVLMMNTRRFWPE